MTISAPEISDYNHQLGMHEFTQNLMADKSMQISSYSDDVLISYIEISGYFKILNWGK